MRAIIVCAIGVGVAMALIIWGLFLPMPALGHDAPMGWSYDSWCCSGKDCRMLHTEVRATPNGWYITETGETKPYSGHGILVSKDGAFHRCENHFVARLPNGQYPTRCLYVPPQNF